MFWRMDTAGKGGADGHTAEHSLGPKAARNCSGQTGRNCRDRAAILPSGLEASTRFANGRRKVHRQDVRWSGDWARCPDQWIPGEAARDPTPGDHSSPTSQQRALFKSSPLCHPKRAYVAESARATMLNAKGHEMHSVRGETRLDSCSTALFWWGGLYARPKTFGAVGGDKPRPTAFWQSLGGRMNLPWAPKKAISHLPADPNAHEG